MNNIAKNLILQEVPLFATLSRAERSFINERSSLEEFKKGVTIYKEGSGPSAFYCVVLGRVVIYTQDAQGSKTVLEYLHRGKYFGIISLLTDEPHSVTAQALNDCLLLIIKKDDFGAMLKKIPRLAIDLSRMLSRRLKRKDIHQKTIFESNIISVFSSHSRSGKTVYAFNLGLSLSKETRKSVIILDILPLDYTHSLPRRLNIQEAPVYELFGNRVDYMKLREDFILKTSEGIGIACFYYKDEDETSMRNLMELLSLLVNDYHFILLDLPALMDRFIFGLLNQSDLIHILTGCAAVDLKETRLLIERLKQEFNFNEEKIKVVINEYRLSEVTHEEQAQILGKDIFATLPRIDEQSCDRLSLESPDCEYAKAIRRISRQLSECLVGLVFGVGVAYGFCHIGVLKVIEEEKIPIDIITGSSVGAIIACFWAMGKSSDEILEITKEFREPKHIWGLVDLTFPFFGFIKGNKLLNFFKKHVGQKTFYDTRIPLKIIASDVKRKEPRVFDKGLLVDALMASCAMPGVFTPFRFKEEMLFDGGIIHPLPTEPLFEMGVRKIIAVNVTPSREDILLQYEKLKKQVVETGEVLKKKNWFSLRQHFKGLLHTNILDIIFSSVEILQSEVAQKEATLADIVLHPDTSGLYWLELHRAPEFAKRGEEETRRNLDKIWKVINE
ncbi:MAG: patatin-like phospholipase family protein [Candidatus Omnitrophota bacterium]